MHIVAVHCHLCPWGRENGVWHQIKLTCKMCAQDFLNHACLHSLTCGRPSFKDGIFDIIDTNTNTNLTSAAQHTSDISNIYLQMRMVTDCSYLTPVTFQPPAITGLFQPSAQSAPALLQWIIHMPSSVLTPSLCLFHPGFAPLLNFCLFLPLERCLQTILTARSWGRNPTLTLHRRGRPFVGWHCRVRFFASRMWWFYQTAKVSTIFSTPSTKYCWLQMRNCLLGRLWLRCLSYVSLGHNNSAGSGTNHGKVQQTAQTWKGREISVGYGFVSAQ